MMEYLADASKTKKEYHLAQSFITKDQLKQVIGRDFNKSVANIRGLVSLLDENCVADQDYDTIRKYLAVETGNLDVMVKKICA